MRQGLFRRMVLASLALTLGIVGPLRSEEPGLADLERQFRTLPIEARRLTGPLFWLHGDESPERLQAILEKVAEGGNGTFTAESRPHSDWLGPGWYRDLAVCLDAAKRLDLTMWIFDEKWWPSGEVGGKVPPQFGTKRISVYGAFPVVGPGHVEQAVSAPPGGQIIAVLAGQEAEGKINVSTIVDLTDHVQNGKLVWDPPAGDWRILPLGWTYSKGRGDRILIDGASQDAVDWYIRTVYQPHYDHFADDFGKTIVGYFYDEPETPGDWGTEVIPELKRRGVDWKRALVAHTVGLADPDDDAAYRYQYRDALAEAWGRTLYGGLTEWCHAHGVTSIGHFLEHNHEYLHPDLCAGNMVQLQKYSDMGAIDAVFKQFVPGQKDDSTYQTPKLGSSISHVYGKKDDLAMVEIFGARGQDLTYTEMKWWTDLMHAGGINFHIPHSFNPRAPYDTDCPPYFYNGGFEPRWPLYRVYADYTTRLSLMLTGGRHVCPIAVLYPGQSVHVGKAVTPEALTTALQEALYDCDWLPDDALAAARIEQQPAAPPTLALHGERYRVLVIPPVEVIPFEALAKARDFFEAGGVVVGYDFLPSKSATPGKRSADVAALCEAIWGGQAIQPGLEVKKTTPRGGRSYFLPGSPAPAQLRQVLSHAEVLPPLALVEGETGGWLRVLHRVKAGRDVYFIANQEPEGPPRRFQLGFTRTGSPEIWDPMRNERNSIGYLAYGRFGVLSLTLEPLESVLLVLSPEERPLPKRIEPGTRPLRKPISVVREPLEVATPEPPRPETPAVVRRLEGGAWVWYPEATDPAVSAPPGTRYFRNSFELPAERKVKRAVMSIAADNDFALFVNGERAGQSGGGSGDWHRPAEIDVTTLIKPGSNVLAIAATNATDRPNPAGLIGRLDVEFASGDPLSIRIDPSWKVSDQEQPDWATAGFDDSTWPAARIVAPFGGGPWGSLARSALTLSPARADPFVGRAEVPADLDLSAVRVCLELDGLAPEEAARVHVNDRDAGGFIGRPLRLDVTRYLRPGMNRLRIEPFAPRSARLAVYAP